MLKVPLKKTLLERCNELGIKNCSKKSKQELIDLISSHSALIAHLPSKNAMVAKSGLYAETLLCESTHEILTRYFGKPVIKCEKAKGRTKSDIIILFEDGSKVMAQMKNGTGGGRGWSFDRRCVEAMPADTPAKDLLKIVCLKRIGERKATPMSINLAHLLLGQCKDTMPEYFIHTTVIDKKIATLSICPTALFVKTLMDDAYETLVSKRTCVYLTPVIYLQRKGGGKCDHSPNDIQAKLSKMPNCMVHLMNHALIEGTSEESTLTTILLPKQNSAVSCDTPGNL